MAQADDIIHAYLQDATAEQRHIFVAHSNYDDNLPHLRYLATQASLDRATASMMFWCLGGRYWAQFPPEHERYHNHAAVLCRELIERIQHGFYVNADIYFDPATDSPVHPQEYSDNADEWQLPSVLYDVVMGCEYVDLDDDGYDDGLPLDVATAVWNAHGF